MHLQLPLAILTSILSLPFTTAAPFAVAPTNEQWQAASARYNNVNNIKTNTPSAGSGEAALLRDAAIFATRPADKVKVKRQVRVRHNSMHALDRRASHKGKRACAVKPVGGEQALLAPAPAASSASASSEYMAESVLSAPAPSASASSEDANANEDSNGSNGSNDSNGVIGGLLDAIFPVHVNSRWTTAQSEGDALSFDAAFKPLAAGSLPPTTAAPDGSLGLHSSFPAGTFKYSSQTGAGFSFYSPGPLSSGVDVTSATEVTLSYSVYFSDGFDFVKGGKLPGLYGGASEDEAKSCSGGRQDNRGRCFSARLMWRKDGMGEFYNYFPTDVQQGGGYCETAPMSHCDAKFGDSIGRGSFYFTPGKWTTVTQRLKLNSPASAQNGEQELWVDGKQVMNLSGLQIRTTDETKIYGVMAQTFFGGGDASWASTKDQDAWFKDWSLGVIA